MKKINKINLIVVAVIIFVLLFAAIRWSNAEHYTFLVINDDGYYEDLDLSAMRIRDSYNAAFREIFLLSWLLFGSAFLLTRVYKE